MQNKVNISKQQSLRLCLKGVLEGNVTHEETSRAEGTGVQILNSASGFTLPEIKKERGEGRERRRERRGRRLYCNGWFHFLNPSANSTGLRAFNWTYTVQMLPLSCFYENTAEKASARSPFYLKITWTKKKTRLTEEKQTRVFANQMHWSQPQWG